MRISTSHAAAAITWWGFYFTLFWRRESYSSHIHVHAATSSTESTMLSSKRLSVTACIELKTPIQHL